MIEERYSNTGVLLGPGNKRVLASTINPPIVPSNGDTYIITTVNDSLDSIAQAFYGDPALWWVLASANALGKGSLKVPAGVQLFIPGDFYRIERELKRLNP